MQIDAACRRSEAVSKITVRDAEGPQNTKHYAVRIDAAVAEDDPEFNQRQRWALERLAKHGELRKTEVVAECKCSPTTAERDLRALRRRGRIEFVGPAKTGHWRLVLMTSV